MISLLFALLLSVCSTGNATGHLKGTVTDRDTGERLGFVYLHLEEAGRTGTARSDGTFRILNVPSGTYTLQAYRLGYQTLNKTVTIPESDTLEIQISLKVSPLSSDAVEVTGNRERETGSRLQGASRQVYGSELRRNLSTTLAKTLESLPGLSSRSMGPAPARPVMRGLGGERLLILQDGERTGDVSSQSADHAVTIDPMSAEQIEIARGPDALAYGSNAIGGVVNVVRNQISPELPEGLYGTVSAQGESVNLGRSGGLEAGFSIGEFAMQLDASARGASNTATPDGTLENSGIFSMNNALGVSLIQSWGYAGGAVSNYLSNYGIPPDPEGGHPDGVDIEMEKWQLDGRTVLYLENSVLKSLQVDLSHKNYYHREIEPGGSIGTEFGLLTTNFSAELNHTGLIAPERGTLGIWGEAKDYAVNGTSTPNSTSYALSAYLIQTLEAGSFKFDAGLRADHVQTAPADEEPMASIGHIRERQFTALSSSVSVAADLGNSFTLGTVLMHSFRAPTQEELYSEGPHLASYSFEVGNPELGPERGVGTELFLRRRGNGFTVDASIYHNYFGNYIYPRNTGRKSIRYPSLNVYQFTGVKAQFAGAEFGLEIPVTDRLAVRGEAGYTWTRREVSDQERSVDATGDRWRPLPMIPPLSGSLEVTYSSGPIQLGSNLRLTADQTRTGEFETETDGYTLLGLYGQYRFSTGEVLHAISVNAENVLDASYRDHLSRIKNLVPEPGRNISFLYRLYF